MSTPRCRRIIVPTLALSLLLAEPAALYTSLRADTNAVTVPIPTPTSSPTTAPTPSPPTTPAPGSTIATGSGLKYVDFSVGKGPVPAVGTTVIVNYVGKLMDGTVFDASSMHGGDGTFSYIQGVTALISGWTEGVSTMHEGGKRKLIIPPELAYGMDGLPGVVPPNATLIFEIELVKVSVPAVSPTPAKKSP